LNPAILQRILQLNPWFERPEAFEDEIRRRIPSPFIPRRVDLPGREDPRKAKLVVGPRLAGVEAKASGRPKVTRSMRSFVQAYAPERLLVVQFGLDRAQVGTLEGTEVVFLPPGDLGERCRTLTPIL